MFGCLEDILEPCSTKMEHYGPNNSCNHKHTNNDNTTVNMFSYNNDDDNMYNNNNNNNNNNNMYTTKNNNNDNDNNNSNSVIAIRPPPPRGHGPAEPRGGARPDGRGARALNKNMFKLIHIDINT